MCSIKPRASTQKAVHHNTYTQNTIDKLKWNSKECFSNPQESKTETENKQKMKVNEMLKL